MHGCTRQSRTRACTHEVNKASLQSRDKYLCDAKQPAKIYYNKKAENNITTQDNHNASTPARNKNEDNTTIPCQYKIM